MTITNKQRKTFWIVGSILAIIYFAPSVIMGVRRVSFAQQQAAQRQAARQRAAQEAALQKARAQSGAPVSAPVNPNAATSKLVGVWEGGATLPPARGFCNLRIEVRAGQEAAAFSGYSTLACSPTMTAMIDPKSSPGLMQSAMLGKGLDPLAAILTGEAKGDSLRFKVDKVIGAATSVGNCVPTSFGITPFGTGEVAAEFQDSCGGGQLLLRRVSK